MSLGILLHRDIKWVCATRWDKVLPDVCVCMIIGDSILPCRCDSHRSVLTGGTSELKAHFSCGYKSVTFPACVWMLQLILTHMGDQFFDHRLYFSACKNSCMWCIVCITPVMSLWCHQGCLVLAFETPNWKCGVKKEVSIHQAWTLWGKKLLSCIMGNVVSSFLVPWNKKTVLSLRLFHPFCQISF